MSDLHICRKCGCGVSVRYGEDHTGFCDECAQEIIPSLVTALEEIRDHEGWDENNCAMKPGRWREHLQEMASNALFLAGLEPEQDVDEDEATS